MLEHLGVSQEDIKRIVARTKDYIDSDHAMSLDGAESLEYRQKGMAPPLNWIMASPLELKEVLGLEDLLSPKQFSKLLPLLTIRPISTYNFNTMHPEILSALIGAETGRASRSAQREKAESTFKGRAAGNAQRKASGCRRNGHSHATVQFMRLEVWNAPRGSRSVVGIELTPFGESAPWRKHYRYSLPVATRDAPGMPQ